MSSEAMVRAISPVTVEFRSNSRQWDHPHDMDDFRRCEVALREIEGLREYLPHMCQASPTWANLVESWDEIVSLAEASNPDFFRPWRELDRHTKSTRMPSAVALLRRCLGRPS